MFKNLFQFSHFSRQVGGILLLTLAVAPACKMQTPTSPVNITNVSATTSQNANNDEVMNFSLALSTNSFIVTAVNLPITDPNDQATSYGSLALQPILCMDPTKCPHGNSVQVSVTLDLTTVLKAKGVSPTLPNGSALPVGGLQSSTVIALPVAQSGVVIYFAFGPGVTLFGTAIPFNQMDVVGKTIAGANIFVPVTVSTPHGNMTLMPGFFTGPTAKTTGIGFFADLSNIVSQSPLLASASAHPASLTADATRENINVQVKSNILMQPVLPPKTDRKKVIKEIIKLNEAVQRLDLI
jgi:hypothetical protein